MNEELLKEIAAQLRQPHGEMGNEMGDRMNQSNALMNRFAMKNLNAVPGDAVLEIGMGNGFFVNEILKNNHTIVYTGCDFSEAMVTRAIQLNETLINQGQATFKLASANDLPFDAESFDKVFTVNTIYFWDNPTSVLNEVKRVMKPTAQLLIALRPRSVMEQYPFTRFGFTMYSADELTALLLANGLSVMHILEENEPDQEMAGEVIKSSSMIVCAQKNH
ncbi:class I SAM-dependent methyltransferase [Emticicia sp. TH156]|uniref:class I SAM-dependent methyltransferase n=1 Tax=Emticicia sp. TH156 TaxID=2067454 RepID=UPI000C758F17|nr:class I SAM-dependent methyltransferase [Emticicia sp. TH156]PLK45826.1 class I SAM-dependent methyltransferase [Emticicia sp. TH156]